MLGQEHAKIEIVNVLWGIVVLLGGLLAGLFGFVVKLAVKNITDMRDVLKAGIGDLIHRQEEWEKSATHKFEELYNSRNELVKDMVEVKTILNNMKKGAR